MTDDVRRNNIPSKPRRHEARFNRRPRTGRNALARVRTGRRSGQRWRVAAQCALAKLAPFGAFCSDSRLSACCLQSSVLIPGRREARRLNALDHVPV